MSDSIFTGKIEQPLENNQEVSYTQSQDSGSKGSDFTELLAGITEEGRQKYADVETALKSILPAQEHIKKLESGYADLEARYKALEEEALKRKTTEETLAALQATNSKGEEKPSNPALDESAVSSLVAKAIAERETQAMRKANVDKVISALNTKYGDKAEERYLAAATAAGMDVQAFNQLAETSPMAVLTLAGVTAQPQDMPVVKSSGSVNTELLQGKAEPISARVPRGASTRDMVNAWRNAGKLINQ